MGTPHYFALTLKQTVRQGKYPDALADMKIG